VARTSSQPAFSQSDLGRWKLVADFQDRLTRAAQKSPLSPSFEDGRRKLKAAQYLSLFLFGLVTNQTPGQLSGALVSQLYRCRWQVELFLRWVKCILGCRHWLAESHEGVALQIYLALIAVLLLELYTGRRPTRRMMELIQFYLLGVASLADLEAGLERERTRLARQKSN
jgi:Transposase DDE domain